MATPKKIQTKYPGIRYYEHRKRKYRGKPDKYFSIRHRVDGEQLEEGFGWLSKGMSAKNASELLTE